MLNINLVYIYPKTIEINNEMNLLRIVDKIEKESLVIYYTKENKKYRKINIKINKKLKKLKIIRIFDKMSE